MRKLIFIALLAGAGWAWQNGYLQQYLPNMQAGSYDDNGEPQLLVFTRDDCGGHCEKGLSELNRRDAPYREIRLNNNDADDPKVQLWKKLGQGNFPYIVAGTDKVAGTSKVMLAALLANNFGEDYLTYTEQRYFNRHFDEQGRAQVIMYGADWCGYCRKLGQDLDAAGIDYIEIDVPKSGEKELMTQTMEIPGYPSVWVGYTRIRNSTSVAQIRTALRDS